MQSHTKAFGYLFATLLLGIASPVLYAQGQPAANDSMLAQKENKVTLQHSIALHNFIGLQYDVRFRTPHSPIDYYAAVNGIPFGNYQNVAVHGGILLGNWYGGSLGIGATVMTLAKDYAPTQLAVQDNNTYIGLPISLRYQPEGGGAFVQLSYAPMLNVTAGSTAQKFSAYPQVQLGYTFGKYLSRRDTTPIPKGIQHTAFAQLAIFGYGVGYDARFRTDSPWLDWAVQGGVGYNRYTYPYAYIKTQQRMGGDVGISALIGKRAIAFEIGLEARVTNTQTELRDYDYKTNEFFWTKTTSTVYAIGVPIGFRIQPPTGGLYFGAAIIPGISTYGNGNGLDIGVKFGLGYSFKTTPKK